MTQLVYGKNVVKQILSDGGKIHKLFLVQPDKEVIALAQKLNVEVQMTDNKTLNRLTGSDRHQGMAIEMDDYPTYSLEDITKTSSDKPGLIIVLDQLEDPHNLGAILRTADAVGANGVIFKKDRSVGLTPTVAKVSAGAIDTVKCVVVTNLVQTLKQLKEKDYWVVGTDMNSQDYRSMPTDRNLVLVIGNEGKGISRLVKEECDYVVSIPMVGKIESLNASVSAGVLLYEIYNKRFPLK